MGNSNSRPSIKPAVVAVAYDRPAALARLLGSLSRAIVPPDVDLVISIDGGGDGAVVEAAEEFDWRFGEKTIRRHSANLGLKKHIISCGDLTEKYGSIILLEDDLYVSPYFYSYTTTAQNFYSDQPKVAGVSLYSHQFNESARLPFVPVDDDSDVYFMQIAASCGQSWTWQQWAPFRRWFTSENDERFDQPGIPRNVRAWAAHSSWKKYFIKYLVERGMYFVYPRVGLTTNFGDTGTNYGYRTTNYQSPVLAYKRSFRFSNFADSPAKYDAWCEIAPETLSAANSKLENMQFCVDLFGDKDPSEIDEPFILTRRPCGHPIAAFGFEMKPPEANVLFDVPGVELGLYRTASVRKGGRRNLAQKRREQVYFYHDTSLTKLAGYVLASAAEKWPNIMIKLRLFLHRVTRQQFRR